MTWPYHYTPCIWPMLGSAAFMWALAIYAWKHRATPGVAPFTFGTLGMGLWALGAAFEAAAVDFPTRLLWFRVQNASGLPVVICMFSFALEYSGLGGWVTRRTLALLLSPAAAVVPLYFVDDSRILVTRIWSGETVHRTFAPMGWGLNLYGMALVLLATAVIIVLFVRSPLLRRPAALILLGHLGPSIVYPLEALNLLPDSPLDLTVLAADFTFSTYAVAMYRFRIFDAVPVARETVLDRMGDGMLVLDSQNRVVDLNSAALELLGVPRSGAVGLCAALALESYPDLARTVCDGTPAQSEISIGTRPAPRWYQVSTSPLVDRRGFRLGRLLVFRDITESKRTQELLVEKQRALAALEERDRVARELHDDLGQVLGFVKMQAQAAQGLVSKDPMTAQSYLAQLSAAAQDAHADIREYILGARTVEDGSGFLASLRQYAQRFTATYGLEVELAVPPDLSDEDFRPAVQVQLLRIIQEALTNARKHSHASHVQVKFALDGGEVEVTVADDGQGFDPGRIEGDGQRYGLRFMRERAQEVGGTLEVRSAPGRSTRVVVRVPRQDGPFAPAPNTEGVGAPKE